MRIHCKKILSLQPCVIVFQHLDWQALCVSDPQVIEFMKYSIVWKNVISVLNAWYHFIIVYVSNGVLSIK